MKKTLLGIVIAQTVLYFFGFVYWGLGPYPTCAASLPRWAL